MNNINKISSILVISLVSLGIINGEYLRPTYGSKPIIMYILGSLPNFIASYVLFILIMSFLVKKNLNYINLIMFSVGVFVFLFLTFEEYLPFFTGNKTFDIFDVFANGVGVLFAFISFKILLHQFSKENYHN